MPYNEALEYCTKFPFIEVKDIEVMAAVLLHKPAIILIYAVEELVSLVPSDE